jgi:beta-galactosidase/beta-glucuronidase
MQCSDAASVSAPNNEQELQSRMKVLRKQTAPFLRSLPPKLEAHSRQILTGNDWISRFEYKHGSRTRADGWEKPELDAAEWEATTVPEWRYEMATSTVPVSCSLWYRKTFKAELPPVGKRVFLVFEGVDWKAEVWLNGQRLGDHSVYFEPFRFDVTERLEENNTLAVRVLDGPSNGEPAAFWAPFPVPNPKSGRYVRDRSKSLTRLESGDTHIGTGFGIFRDVYLETTGPAIVSEVQARGYPARQEAVVRVETDVAGEEPASVKVELLPENFEGAPFNRTVPFAPEEKEGRQVLTVKVPMLDARRWSPEAPFLYRCRVSLLDRNNRVIDARDVLFGHRTVEMVNDEKPREGLQSGTLLLDGRPLFLRGTNIQGLNALQFWGEDETLLDVLLLLKAADFNAVRSCQHIQFPEVRELMDRLGIMSQQDVGSRYPKFGEKTRSELIRASGVAAKVCYNNPGVVLVTFANETEFNPADMLKAALAFDPERIFVPISGRSNNHHMFSLGKDAWAGVLAPELRSRVIDSFHPYWGWYAFAGAPWGWCQVQKPGRMLQAGEYGGEALDAYETMERYPKHWGSVPAKDADTLWGHVQVKKQDIRQIMGFRGREPSNLGEYIEASQNYQYDQLAELTKAWRLSPRRITAYFQFHFIDVLPANWPKSIVSHDLKPKRSYFAMAQVNQPLVPLPRVLDRGKDMELWVANDWPEAHPGCLIRWAVLQEDETLAEGKQPVDVPASGAVKAGTASLAGVPDEAAVVDIRLTLEDFAGAKLGEYEQEVFLAAWRKHEAAAATSPKQNKTE